MIFDLNRTRGIVQPMLVTVEIPDEFAAQLPKGNQMSRELLNAYAAEAYRSNHISRRQVGLLLGLDRWKTEEFLTKRDANRIYGAEDFELERGTTFVTMNR
jgi:hypothetical protein